MESLAKDKHSSLLRKSVNYGRKKFHNIGPWTHCCETFYVCNLRMFVISWCFSLPSLPAQSNVCKEGFEWSTFQVIHFRVGPWPYPQVLDRLKKLDRDIRSRLLQTRESLPKGDAQYS
jgi:hypothetical protein